METRICLESALEIWHVERLAACAGNLVDPCMRLHPLVRPRSAMKRLASGSPTECDINGALAWSRRRAEERARACGYAGVLMGLTAPVQTLVSAETPRWATAYRIPYGVREDVLPGSLVRLSDGLYVCSPEQVVLHMARHLDELELIWLMSMMCATFTRHPDSRPDADELPAFPSTCGAWVGDYLGRALERGDSGARKAARALTHAVEGAASSRELELVLQATLPCAQGGKGIKKPLLNYRIEVDQRLASIHNWGYFSVDACWPQEKVVLEFNSDAHHLASRRAARDNDKAACLEQMGYEVVSVSSAQLDSLVQTEDALRRVMHYLGMRDRSVGVAYDWQARRSVLRSRLYRLRTEGVAWPWAPRRRGRACGMRGDARRDTKETRDEKRVPAQG